MKTKSELEKSTKVKLKYCVAHQALIVIDANLSLH